MLANAIYILCTLTSLLCAVLLLSRYRQTGVRILLWSALCFVGLTVNNTLLFVDLVLLPDSIDLRLYRNLAALVGMLFLIYGFIRESE